MGLAGLALAWSAAATKMGPAAEWVARGTGGLAALLFLGLLVLFSRRGRLYPEALNADLLHPVRHAYIATITISMILLATLGTTLLGPSIVWASLWLIACVLQLAVTVWVLSRWLRGNTSGGFQWPGITPVLIIPVVGNVLVPLAGVPLGQHEWAAVQFGIGAFQWPVLMALIFMRIGVHGLWPDRLLPTAFITVAPAALIGLSLLRFETAPALAQGCWGIALFFLLWSAQVTEADAGPALLDGVVGTEFSAGGLCRADTQTGADGSALFISRDAGAGTDHPGDRRAVPVDGARAATRHAAAA